MSLMTIQNLSAGYGKLTVLNEVSLTIELNQFMAILGPNGSGKSTLVKSIFGLTDIFDGSIRIRGAELVGRPTEQIGSYGIAYVPQRENVFAGMTVEENLSLAVRKLPAEQAKLAIAETIAIFPILRDRQKQLAGLLSGGERQMVAIAMAFLARPRLMLLDEPSAGLAPLFVTEIFKQLHKLIEADITLVVVEQNARSILQWCDATTILREGRIAFQGTAAQALADQETVKGYLGVGPRRRAS